MLDRGCLGMVLARQLQGRQRHLAVKALHRRGLVRHCRPGGQALGDVAARQGNCIGHVLGQQALVQAVRGVHHRLAAQQHLQELQARQIAAQHQAAGRQRRRQDQANRSPQRSPERGGDDDGQGRQPRAAAVQPGLDNVVADQLQHQHQRQGPHQHVPARCHGKRQGQREHRSHQRPHVGHKAHHHGQHPPQDGPGHANQPQARRHGHAIGHIHDALHAQVAADAVGGLVHGIGRHVRIAPHQAQQPVAQVVAVQQDQDHEQQHDAGLRQRLADLAQPLRHAQHGLVLIAHHLDLLDPR